MFVLRDSQFLLDLWFQREFVSLLMSVEWAIFSSQWIQTNQELLIWWCAAFRYFCHSLLMWRWSSHHNTMFLNRFILTRLTLITVFHSISIKLHHSLNWLCNSFFLTESSWCEYWTRCFESQCISSLKKISKSFLLRNLKILWRHQ
jgi:hypothetical protein